MRRGNAQLSLTGWTLWLVYFLYSLAVGLWVQRILVPYFLPSLDSGNGLLIGFDFVNFDKVATVLAAKIHVQGWGAWELRPGGFPNSGILAAIYVFTGPNPAVLLPLNAFFHATAAWVLYQIFRAAGAREKIAALSTLPFVLFPSSLTWVSQIHKDGMGILGTLLFLWAWVEFGKAVEAPRPVKPFMKAFVGWLASIGCLFVMRAYLIGIFSLLAPAFAALITMVYWQKIKLPFWPRRVVLLLIWIIAVLGMGEFAEKSRGITLGGMEAESDRAATMIPSTPVIAGTHWQKSKILPAKLDNKLYGLAVLRDGYRSENARVRAATAVDEKVGFESAQDIVRYLPRAAEIAFLSPFPSQWRQSNKPGGFFRMISGAETLFVYLLIPFMAWALWLYRKRLPVMLSYAFCVPMMLLLSLVIMNVGTLYRMRYGFLMVLVGFAIIALADTVQKVSTSTPRENH